MELSTMKRTMGGEFDRDVSFDDRCRNYTKI